jgi:hypothetical protein
MAEWRDILEVASKAEWRESLERAADNLSVDFHRGQQPAGWPVPQANMGQSSFAASRHLLARELGATPSPAPARPQRGHPQQRQRAVAATAGRASITQSIGEPLQGAPQPAAKKGGTMRELVTLLISVGIVATAVGGFFVLLH